VDVESHSDHRPSGFDRFQVTLKAVVFPLDVQESDALELADVAQIGVASARQPAKSAGNSKDASTVSYEFQDHLAKCGFILSREEGTISSHALPRRVIRKLEWAVQRYRTLYFWVSK
jgi:hypothetical protein